MKINLLPSLRNILAGCYTPEGGYTEQEGKPGAPLILKPWGPDHQPAGSVSLSAADFEAFTVLCKQVKYKPEGEIQDIGQGGASIAVKDLAAAIQKAGPELEVVVDAPSAEE